jgi:hypothetical protein
VTSTDFCGRPPAVLKTAGLGSVTVHQRLLEVDRQAAYSATVRRRPQTYGNLAVISAVMDAHKSLDS